MTAAEILSQLQVLGVGIRLHGDALVCRPLRNVPAELAEQIRAHKPELVAILAGPALGLAAQPRWTVFPRAGEELASSSLQAAIDEAADDYPAGVLCCRDGCRGLGWDRDPESGGWRCRACTGPLPEARESRA